MTVNAPHSPRHVPAADTLSGREISLLQRLMRLNRDAELGYETAAEHVKNRALKLLLKECAAQRALFSQELIQLQPQALSSHASAGSRRAGFHRGLIDIRAALTVGRDARARVVLNESLRGERLALSIYEDALSSQLAMPLRNLLDDQYVDIRDASARLAQLACQSEQVRLVQLYDDGAGAERVRRNLQDAGIADNAIAVQPLNSGTAAYDCACQRSRNRETMWAGTLLGASFGALLGALVGFALRLDPESAALLANNALAMMLISMMAAGLVGGMAGALFGLIIGLSTTEDDLFVYDASRVNGDAIVIVVAPRREADRVRRILRDQRNYEMGLAYQLT